MTVAGLPLATILLRPLPSAGALLAKPLGLLLFAYVGWLLLFTGIFENTRAYHAGVLAGLFAASVAALIGHRGLRERARSHWRKVAVAEAIFAAAYLLFLAYRSTNAEIWGTEKPMDFAMLNGVFRSQTFPPRDPWFAGHAINYYYFGYAIAAALTKIGGAAPAVSYNLALGVFAAISVLGAFALGFDVCLISRPSGRRSAALAGFLAASFTMLAGNLFAIHYFFGGGFKSGDFWKGLGWAATRVIQVPNADGYLDYTINEFPAFSFILGDLHPHVMGLGFTLIAMSVAVAWMTGRWQDAAKAGLGWPAIGLSGWLLGALYVLNSWDLPTFAILAGLAGLAGIVSLGAARKMRALFRLASELSAALAVAVAAYLPFHLGFQPFASGVRLVQTRSDLAQFLTIYGLWLLLGGSYIGFRLWRAGGAVFWLFAGGLVVAGLLKFAANDLAVVFLCGVLASGALAALLLERRRREGAAVLVLLFAGFGLAGLPEIVYLDDFFDAPSARMNTVFKLYYQVWPMLAVASAVAAVRALTLMRGARGLTRALAVGLWAPIVAFLLFIAMAYTVIAGAEKSAWYDQDTLDGLAYARYVNGPEMGAIEWLARNAPPPAIVLEAAGMPYTDYGRVSAWTGVPALLGWIQHEQLWRNSSEEVLRRAEDIDALYRGLAPGAAMRMLRRYGVSYVYVGLLERQKYGSDTAERFAYLPVAFRVGARAVIFAVPTPLPGAPAQETRASTAALDTSSARADGLDQASTSRTQSPGPGSS